MRSIRFKRGGTRRALIACSLLCAVVLGVSGAPGSATSTTAPSTRAILGDAVAGAPAPATSVPLGFEDSVAFSGLTNPTAVRFATDGRVFVAEKSGLLKVFDGLTDSTPTTVVDLREQVDDYWDRGLLGLALDPGFPAIPYVYLLYTYDAPPGQTAPVWNDDCKTPPGPTSDGCVVTGKLVRIQVSAGDQQVGIPQVLIENQWCQQYPSHSVGDLGFGSDGKLYVSGGEGASFTGVDYGQMAARSPARPPEEPVRRPAGRIGGTRPPVRRRRRSPRPEPAAAHTGPRY